MINTNLPPILHRFQVVSKLFVKFSLARGDCLTLTLSPANIAINDISLKLDSLAYISAAESIRVSSNTLLCNAPRKLPNSLKLRTS